jgi:hypothetical protein
MYERRVLKRTYGQQREQVNGGWKKLHNEVHNFEIFTKCYGDEIKGSRNGSVGTAKG